MATPDEIEPPDAIEPPDEPIPEPPRIRVQGTWWRITRADSDPLFWSTEPADGRWQRGSVVRALYLGDSEAMVLLAGLYASGDGVPADFERARSLLEGAIAAGKAEDGSDKVGLAVCEWPDLPFTHAARVDVPLPGRPETERRRHFWPPDPLRRFG